MTASFEILRRTIRNVVSGDLANSADRLRQGQALHLSDPAAARMLKLAGFSAAEPGGRWMDRHKASIDIWLLPESGGPGRLRLHVMPFVTEELGQTLRVRWSSSGDEKVVDVPPGVHAWKTVDLPLAERRNNEHVRIDLAVERTFVPTELGLSADARALGVMIRQIEFLFDAGPERVETDDGAQTVPSRNSSAGQARELVPLLPGGSVSLASPNAEQAVRLSGVSWAESDGRWTDQLQASIGLRLVTETLGVARLRVQLIPFVADDLGQTIRLSCGGADEAVVRFSRDAVARDSVELRIGEPSADGLLRIQVAVDRLFVPSQLGIGSDPRALGVKIREVELLADPGREAGSSRPEEVTEMLEPDDVPSARASGFHDDPRSLADPVTALRGELARLASGALGAQDIRLATLQRLIAALHEKVDLLVNRFVLQVDDDTLLVRSLIGYLYCPRSDHSLLSCLATIGELEPGLRRLLERVLEPGMTFVDVGAHIGVHTLAAARRVGSAGHVFAFEPTPATHVQLQRSLKLNALDSVVTARQAAVGSRNTKQPLHLSAICGHNSLYPLSRDETGIVEVDVVRLDDELPPRRRIDVVKIDVEGAELDVLSGMSRIVAENPGLLIVAEYGPSHLARVGAAPEVWLSAFRSSGFDAFVVQEPSGICVPIERVDLSEVESVNVAFIRRSSTLRSSVEAQSPGRTPVVVIGAGGHSKVVVEVLRSQGLYEVLGCTDPDPKLRGLVGVPILGTDDVLPELFARGVRHCFIALGDNALRKKLSARVKSLGFVLVNAISPSASLSPSARLGSGVAVMAGAVINADARVGDLAIVNTRAVVEHDCDVGEAAHVATNAALAGNVRLGPLVFVGAGATVIPDVSIGESTVVGAGATVISNLGPRVVAVGVPARVLQSAGRQEQVDHGEER